MQFFFNFAKTNIVMEVRYFINEKNIKSDFGVYVAASEGVLDLPKIKATTVQDWHEYHGTLVDLEPPKLQEREITLDCWITAPSQIDFIEKLNLFYAEFLKGGFKRLRIEIGDDVPPLIYDTYLKDSIKITKQWGDGSQQGKFKIKLAEPNPQKKILKFTAAAGALTCSLHIQTPMSVIITWGDNTRTEEIFSDGFDAVHTFAEPGIYYISIGGVISEITDLEIDEQTEIIWQIL